MKYKYCVYASSLTDAAGRDSAPGDGITSPLRRLYGLAATKAEAEQILARLMASKTMNRARIPGDGHSYPELEIDEYDPLDFVGSQDRDNYAGKRYAALCGELEETAKRNAATL